MSLTRNYLFFVTFNEFSIIQIFFSDWESIKRECKTPGAADVDGYDFMQNMESVIGNGIDFVGKNNTCGNLITPLITMPDKYITSRLKKKKLQYVPVQLLSGLL